MTQTEHNLAARLRRALRKASPYFRLKHATITEMRNGLGPWQLIDGNTIRNVGSLEFMNDSWQQTLRG
ncbi:MAG: hypothetical protein NVS1B11_31260 [Terriglobales bacterium]